MKETHRCPKCSHHEILYVPKVHDRDDASGGPFAVYVEPSIWVRGAAHGELEALICRKCGYTEFYTTNAAGLPMGRIPGAKLLVGTPPVPYR